MHTDFAYVRLQLIQQHISYILVVEDPYSVYNIVWSTESDLVGTYIELTEQFAISDETFCGTMMLNLFQQC